MKINTQQFKLKLWHIVPIVFLMAFVLVVLALLAVCSPVMAFVLLGYKFMDYRHKRFRIREKLKFRENAARY